MKKTNKMAVIGQRNCNTGNYIHIERRVYADDNGSEYVKVNGDLTPLEWFQTNRLHTVSVYY